MAPSAPSVTCAPLIPDVVIGGQDCVALERVALAALCTAKTVARAASRGHLETRSFCGRLFVTLESANAWIAARRPLREQHVAR